MITGISLTSLLHAIATDHPDRALNILINEVELDEDLCRAMYVAVSESDDPADQARGVGDALRDAEASQFLVNECYRLAFYLSDEWSELAENPLYAQFVANRAARVLDKWVHYFPVYHRHLERFRGKPVRVLEIGVYRGGGLSMWAKYLGQQSQLVGLDIDEAAVRAVKGKYPVILGDQENPEVLRKLNEEYGPFDVIIDDGGHTMRQQIVTIETLFPLLNDGGIFIVEDTHTSYWSEFGGGLRDPGSFVEWSKPRVDDLHSRHDAGIDRNSVWATELDGMHWYDSIVVFDKQHRFRPFNEMAGSASYLWADRYSEGIAVEMLATRDQALRDRDELQGKLAQLTATEDDTERTTRLETAWLTAEELRIARSELRRAQDQLAQHETRLSETSQELERTRGELLDSWAMVRDMRHTGSWRLTKPLRAVRRLVSR